MSDIHFSAAQLMHQMPLAATATSGRALDGLQLKVQLMSDTAITFMASNQTIKVPKQQVSGSLQTGQTYQLKQIQKQQFQLIPLQSAPPQRQVLSENLSNSLAPKAIASLLQQGTDPLTLTGRVVSQDAQKLTLKLPSGQQLQVPAPGELPTLPKGGRIDLALTLKQQQWQLNVTTNKPPLNATSQLQPQQVARLARVLTDTGSSVTLPKTQLHQWQQQLLIKSSKQELGQALKQQPADKVKVGFTSDGRLTLHANHKAQPSATLRLNSENQQQLKAAVTPSTNAIKAPEATHNLNSQLRVTAISPKPEVVLSDRGLSLSPKISLTQPPSSDLLQRARQATVQTQQQVVDLVRQLQSQQTPPANSLTRIQTALSELKALDPKGIMSQMSEQLTQNVPQGKADDVQQLRHLFTLPPLALSAPQLTSSPPQSGMMGGLITLLQIALSARQSRQRPEQGQRLAEALNTLLQGKTDRSGGSPQAITPRALSDLAQLDQRHQLGRQLGQLINSHQASKLGSADTAMQGQEVFHYSLPLGGEPCREAELLLQREDSGSANSGDDAPQDKRWKLTMKLTVDSHHAILAKARLLRQELELELYTDSPSLKTKANKYMPLLEQRLHELGLTVTHTQCELGQIPANLDQRPYHLFETQA